jgi:hypothetical protein
LRLSRPSDKNISLSPSGKSPLEARASRALEEGRFAIVTTRWHGMRWTLLRRQDERRGSGRRSRVVLTSRRWRQVLEKLALLRDDGDKKARSPGRARNKPLNHRAGNAGMFGEPVVTNSCAFFTLRTRLRVRLAPGIPCALHDGRDDRFAITRRRLLRGKVKVRLRRLLLRRPGERRDPRVSAAPRDAAAAMLKDAGQRLSRK